MLPLPDAHQSNLAGQPRGITASLRRRRPALSRFRNTGVTALWERVQRMFLLIAIRVGGICAACYKRNPYRLSATSQSRVWLS